MDASIRKEIISYPDAPLRHPHAAVVRDALLTALKKTELCIRTFTMIDFIPLVSQAHWNAGSNIYLYALRILQQEQNRMSQHYSLMLFVMNLHSNYIPKDHGDQFFNVDLVWESLSREIAVKKIYGGYTVPLDDGKAGKLEIIHVNQFRDFLKELFDAIKPYALVSVPRISAGTVDLDRTSAKFMIVLRDEFMSTDTMCNFTWSVEFLLP